MLDKNKLYYLSHPFTSYGDKKENQEKAADIEMRLREKYGIKVINPILLPLGSDSDKAMYQCRCLHDACDETIFCDNWDKSKGCKEEFTWCNDLNRRYHLTELLLEDKTMSWLEKFKERKLAIHCSTEYEAATLMDILKKEGFSWISGKALTTNMWNLYKEKTCYICDSEFFNKLRRFSTKDTCADNFKIITIDNILNENKEKSLEDNVNNPSHYNQGIECIDYIESHDFNFNLGNAIKYISRCEHKGNKESDIEKAVWYLKRELEKENK